MPFNHSDNPKVPLRVGSSVSPCNPWTGRTRLSIPLFISIGSPVFAQLTAEITCTVQCALKRD